MARIKVSQLYMATVGLTPALQALVDKMMLPFRITAIELPRRPGAPFVVHLDWPGVPDDTPAELSFRHDCNHGEVTVTLTAPGPGGEPYRWDQVLQTDEAGPLLKPPRVYAAQPKQRRGRLADPPDPAPAKKPPQPTGKKRGRPRKVRAE